MGKISRLRLKNSCKENIRQEEGIGEQELQVLFGCSSIMQNKTDLKTDREKQEEKKEKQAALAEFLP